MNDNFDFFISYRRVAASSIVGHILGALDRLKYKTFLDVKELKNSNDWKRSIDDNLRKSRVMLVVLAKGSFESGHADTGSDEFLYEISKAKEMAKPLITIDYGGFFSAKEFQHIRDENIVKWLNGPTALSFEPSQIDSWSNLIASIVERMLKFEREIDSFGRHLPDEYIEDHMDILRSRAKKFFENDRKIDHRESNQLFAFAKEKHLCEEDVIKIIDEVERDFRPYIQPQVGVEVAPPTNINTIIDPSVTVEPVDSSVISPSSSQSGLSNLTDDKASSNLHIEGDVVSPEIAELEKYDSWEYFKLGAMKVSEVLDSPERGDLVSYICFYAFDDEDVAAGVIDKLQKSNPTSTIADAIEEYAQFLDLDVIGNYSVATARDWSMTRVISRLVRDLDFDLISGILSLGGNTKVRNAFLEFWPDDPSSQAFPDTDYQSIGSMKAIDVLDHEWCSELIGRIEVFSQKSKQTVRKYLNNAELGQLVIDAVKGFREFAYLSNLAGYNVKFAKDYELAKVIADALKLTDTAPIEEILASTNGHTLLKKAFSEYWPK
jgi:hypothetical protein